MPTRVQLKEFAQLSSHLELVQLSEEDLDQPAAARGALQAAAASRSFSLAAPSVEALAQPGLQGLQQLLQLHGLAPLMAAVRVQGLSGRGYRV